MYDKFDQIRASIQPKPKFAFKKSVKKNDAVSLQANAIISRLPPEVKPTEALKHAPSKAGTPGSGPTDTASVQNDSTGKPRDTSQGLLPGSASNNAGIGNPSTTTDAVKRPDAHNILSASTNCTSISSQKNVHLTLPLSATHGSASGLLTNLQDCLIDMTTSRAIGNHFATLVIKNVQQCLLMCGSVNGAVHITSAQRSVIVVAARQFRMHDCKDCIVYLHANGQPIIENCQGIEFASIPAKFVG